MRQGTQEPPPRHLDTFTATAAPASRGSPAGPRRASAGVFGISWCSAPLAAILTLYVPGLSPSPRTSPWAHVPSGSHLTTLSSALSPRSNSTPSSGRPETRRCTWNAAKESSPLSSWPSWPSWLNVGRKRQGKASEPPATAPAPEAGAEPEAAAAAPAVQQQAEVQPAKAALEEKLHEEVAAAHVTGDAQQQEWAAASRKAEEEGEREAELEKMRQSREEERRSRAAARAAEQKEEARAAAAAMHARALERERKSERLVSATRWEAFQRKQEAKRKATKAAKKLADAKKADFERMVVERQQEEARLQKLSEKERKVVVPSGSVRVNVVDKHHNVVQITVEKEGVRARVLMAAAIRRMGLEGKKVHFSHRGVELKDDDLIEKYNLEDLDTVNVKTGWL
mmetsp:Transcript_75230/g.234240  ORF Transcript_75230/g.234240 Transcript_75230/m.234240 type:complete len:397 (-) Transcript_75230:69-1259(-)